MPRRLHATRYTPAPVPLCNTRNGRPGRLAPSPRMVTCQKCQTVMAVNAVRAAIMGSLRETLHRMGR